SGNLAPLLHSSHYKNQRAPLSAAEMGKGGEMNAVVRKGPPCSGEIQSCCPKEADPKVAKYPGHDYYKPDFVPPNEEVTEVDDRDKGTPDDWVKRHPALVRLTGRHPFNVEPPIYQEFDHGFITPVSLHYVRNHGAACNLSYETHTLKVNGLVERPLEMSMDFLRSNFKEVTIPVTLVCAGNRRKEENMIKQGLGFSWGPAAVSNAMWTGVWLKDVLEYAGIKSYEEGAQNVCMVGADKLPNGYYGTSIRREVAMSDDADVLIAYKMNGEELTPDHGYPVRIIIPGYIGGRMIKWMTDITVTTDISDNFYHFFDNRVLPPQVDAEKALAEGWWYKPEYIINELNVNSAVVYPRHDEILPLNGATTYTVKGYCYGGGGMPINRMEVSFNDGETWDLCELAIPEKPRHMGKYWCWVFWEYTVDVARLLHCKEIVCRGWQGQNTQPQVITWNLLGMMNNCWFRCKVHPIRTENGQLALKFEHPTQPGPQPGGWMVKDEGPVVAPAKVPPKSGKKYTLKEVSRHDGEDDCWIVVEDKVYDVTSFLDDHPGGSESITISAGEDATDEFNALHSQKARNMLADYYIGDVGGGRTRAKSGAAADPDALITLQPKKKVPLKLIEKEELSANSRRFRFALPTPQHKLGLPIGQHFFVSGMWKDEFVIRAYTPVTGDEVTGYVDLVIKVYFPNEKFPEGGKMSQLLESLSLGDTIDVKGPLGEIVYLGPGEFLIKKQPRSGTIKKLGLISGGTGITPMYQVAKAMLSDPNDTTEIYLLDANISEEDILLREELDALAAKHPRFHVWYTIDKASKPDDWKYSTGFISKEMIAEHLPKAGDETLAFMCGPPPMINLACIPNLK
ncbi:unnamed protein product, partial [Chrysoparadoxa australica]